MVMIRAALIFSWKTFFYRWLNLREIAATPLHSLDRCPNKHSALPIGKVAASNWKGPLQNEKIDCLALGPFLKRGISE